jgi:hypothetical protein
MKLLFTIILIYSTAHSAEIRWVNDEESEKNIYAECDSGKNVVVSYFYGSGNYIAYGNFFRDLRSAVQHACGREISNTNNGPDLNPLKPLEKRSFQSAGKTNTWEYISQISEMYSDYIPESWSVYKRLSFDLKSCELKISGKRQSHFLNLKNIDPNKVTLPYDVDPYEAGGQGVFLKCKGNSECIIDNHGYKHSYVAVTTHDAKNIANAFVRLITICNGEK